VVVDWQADEDTGSDTWYEVGELLNVQRDEFVLNLGEVQQFRLRLRMYTTTATTPPVVNAYEVQGWVFNPLKYQWVSSFRVDQNQLTNTSVPDFTPDKIVDFLRDAHEKGKVLTLRSVIPTMDDKKVLVSAPVVHRDWIRPDGAKSSWGGSIDVAFREA